MASEELSVAVCQLTSVDDFSTNLNSILKLLATLEGDAPDLVCFPENALYLRVKEGEKVPGIELNDGRLKALSEWSARLNSFVHIGSVPLSDGGRLYNSSLLFSPDGSVRDSYRKIHLFDVDVEGHKPVRESDVFTHGAEPTIFEVKGWKIGSSICYDLRFAELFLEYARKEVDAILIPSAFLVPTGRAHWEVLIRARAIESQAYVLAAAQGGLHVGLSGGQRATYGHSMIVDPWGVVVESCPEEFGEKRVLRAKLQRSLIKRVRAQIPMKNHRRL